MRLSKREAKARTKLIQENHYNKEEQRILDEAAAVNRFAAATKDFPAYPFSEAVAVE